ncbi:sugar nucleotide-binding protein, partial [Escherichia coli]|uniref:sugar nucleotide-binding protein n=1 Tax=Escherichia coli TaxID=562 RepID=UPI0039E047E1
ADVETARAWSEYSTIINAAAFTRVDAAETPEGRREAWASNVTGVARLARIAVAHRITLVHFSTDYVFDGSKVGPYTEEDPVS